MTLGTDREEIVRRFQALLDAALASENPPAGIDAGILESVLSDSTSLSAQPAPDEYALWEAMTALTQEIKLQGRAFQELNRTLTAQSAERERAQRRETERRCRRDVLGALIDLRDRLARGLEPVRKREAEINAGDRGGWLHKVLGRIVSQKPADDGAALGALVRGYELSIERLDQTLDEFNAREIRCEGEKFDPRRMNAIDSEESATVAPDTVIEVYRSGYEWDGEVFRTAQVKVSRQPKEAVE